MNKPQPVLNVPYLFAFRRAIAKRWDEATVSPKFLPIDPSKPTSTGQCAPTSYVLLQKLREDFPGSDFTLAIGEVRQNGQTVAIAYHVWVVEIAESPKDNHVIDVTGDQGSLDEVTYASVRDLAARFIHADAMARARLLQARYLQG